MGDEIQPSKKRAAVRELSRDNPGLDDEENGSEQEMGTFQKASEEVLAARRIVKVRRQHTSTESSAPASNPFAGIRLVPPPATTTNVTTEAKPAEEKPASEDVSKIDETKSETEAESKETEEKPADVASKEQAAETTQVDRTGEKDEVNSSEKATEPETADEKEADDGGKKTAEAKPADEKQAEGENTEGDEQKENEKSNTGASGGGTPLSSFGQLSNNQNAFTGLSGTGFSSSSFSFGSIQKDGSPSQSSLPTFSFGTSNNGNMSLFGAAGASIGTKSEASALRPLQEVPTETGEENEETVFSADSALFEFFEGGWKERGKGEVKLNVLKSDTQKARLVMRAKGNLRLILNASLYPDMKLTKMDKKGVTFPCVNIATEGKDGLSTFALKFKDSSIVEEFSTAVSAHKGKPPAASKTPENSPKASQD